MFSLKSTIYSCRLKVVAQEIVFWVVGTVRKTYYCAT